MHDEERREEPGEALRMPLREAGCFLGRLATRLPKEPRLDPLVLQPHDLADITEPRYFSFCILRER